MGRAWSEGAREVGGLERLEFLDDGCEDGDELIGFVEKGGELVLGNDGGGDEEAEPVVRFAGFLQRDRHFGEVVRTALAALGFSQIGADRGAGPQKLVCQWWGFEI